MNLNHLTNLNRWLAHASCVGLLALANASEPNAIDADFFSALRSGDVQRLRTQLDRGASPNAADLEGNTALMLSAAYGDTASLRLLLERGAQVNATNRAGATALLRAANQPEKVKLLVERRADVNARSAAGNTAIILAARTHGSRETLELLLKHGADVNATNLFGGSALMAAAAADDEDSVALLLRHGANANALPTQDEPGFVFGGGRSPLMWAAFRGNTGIMKQLLKAGAEINVPSLLGTPLGQATWADRNDAARLLLSRGADPSIMGFMDGYAPLHWAASTEQGNDKMVKLLLKHGANPNAGGGEHVDAFLGTLQTPLMLAKRRGNEEIIDALVKGGATSETPDRVRKVDPPARQLPEALDDADLRAAINAAMPPLHLSSLVSKESFVKHESRQDCTSCHQQHLPMAAMGLAREFGAQVNRDDEAALIEIVRQGDSKDAEADWQALFHPDAVMTKGYELFAYAGGRLAADYKSDSWVHHLAAIQGPEGQWYNNLPRPPIQNNDVGATALAIHALQLYPLPGREAEMRQRVSRGRQWLWKVKPANTDGRAFQLLGLAWSGEPPSRLKSLARALLAEQRADGGWAQLPDLQSDAYATGQVIYALRVAAGMKRTDPAIDRAIRHLLTNQLEDGTWHVRRRAYPFQPTMNSGFPHGRDGWISAAATSWAVMALSLPDEPAATSVANQGTGRQSAMLH